MGAVVGERILVEVVLAVEREAWQDGVVEGVFDQVGVPGFASESEHAPVPHHAGNSGAGLRMARSLGSSKSFPNASPS